MQKYLQFDTVEGDQIIRLKDILFFESCKNYYLIYHAGGQVYKCRGTLSDVEQRMKEFDFYRVHSAYLVNLDHIQAIKSNSKLTVTDGHEISKDLEMFG